VKLRSLERRDVDAAGALMYEAFRAAALEHGARPAWKDAAEATRLVELYLDGGVVADFDGAVAGVGFWRKRGDAATLGPLAAASPGRGVGGKILDELVARAEAAGASSLRLFQDGWNAASFALYAGRSFAAVDTIAALERPAGAPPRIDSARGLEVTAFSGGDLAEIAALDLRLTGLDRKEDLVARLRLVARRRGVLVGFLGGAEATLGPALALDAADLGALISRALQDARGAVSARLSTAAPTAMLVALGLGFRVTGVGTMMVRGVTPPARPPQMFGIIPEIL
jgi:hypothetical protein